jgi:hypothetical protein
MSPRCSKSHYRGDVGKVEELIVELESDEDLEAALRREIRELSASDQPLGPEAEEDAFHRWQADQSCNVLEHDQSSGKLVGRGSEFSDAPDVRHDT